ncbi:MAG: formate/nitrite transporter family protein [Desulfuromonas thiophila]|nr:formate/nitrite transporter family protein [Desulfuromonas thiophila]
MAKTLQDRKKPLLTVCKDLHPDIRKRIFHKKSRLILLTGARMPFIAPGQLLPQLMQTSVTKALLRPLPLLLLGFLAGAYIGFAAHLATVISTGDIGWFGLKKFLAGAVFSLGLMLVIIPGSELWTGNTLMTAAWLEGKIRLRALLWNWLWVYLGNLAGAVFLAGMIAAGSGLLDGPVGSTALQIASSKIAAEAWSFQHNLAYFCRAICCNWLVCLAVVMALAAQDIGGKILAIFFPIMAFVASGFEHAIANMYFIPAGIFSKQLPQALSGAGLSATELERLNPLAMWTDNLLAVSLGNLVGGAFFVAGLYWWAQKLHTDR